MQRAECKGHCCRGCSQGTKPCNSSCNCSWETLMAPSGLPTSHCVTYTALNKPLHRQLWPRLLCLREELQREWDPQIITSSKTGAQEGSYYWVYLYSCFLESEMHGAQLPIWFDWVFHCNRQSSREKTSTNQKTTQKPPKNWEKQHHSLKLQDKASKFNSDNLFTWSRHYLPLHLSCHLYSPFPLFPSASRLFFFSCPCKAQGIFLINPFSVTGFTDLKLISIY